MPHVPQPVAANGCTSKAIKVPAALAGYMGLEQNDNMFNPLQLIEFALFLFPQEPCRIQG